MTTTVTVESGFRERKSRRRRRRRYWWRTYGLRTCPVCGGEFKATQWNQVYCPPTDRDRDRAEHSQARSRCAKRADNATQRDQDPTARPLPQPFNCAQCGKPCIPGEDGVAPHATKFCCRAHKARWHREAAKDAA